ncbi:MAG: NAD(P)-dependent alcohol dehydrogenase [Elusimicrobia bacterium]|nr:NAD(P)-dependent alcohol dehydrogenase [Elusimicrobiota bacterium]
MLEAKGYAVRSPNSPLEPFRFTRRDVGERDIRVEIAFCGICHSDIHQARDEWGGSAYPMVPGHEIVGRVTQVGRKVRGFKAGDTAGIGCMVDSCRRCPSCRRGLEQHCDTHVALTYNGTEMDEKTPTQGGYSDHIVVDEAFAVKVPPKMPLDRVAPLLCAGITTYSPLKRLGARKGSRVGVMGLGGLGHMAVKIAAAMGAEVTVLSHSPSKRADAKRLGAHEFAVTTDAGAVKSLAKRFDIIIDTVSADHDIDASLSWLSTEGELVIVGAPPKPLAIRSFSLILGRRKISGSAIGGIAETQEMLDFCAKKKALSDVEVIAMRDVNAAYERMMRGDVRYRFVIDNSTL